MSYKSSCVPRSYRNAQDFFIGAAVLGQFGHSIALEMAGLVLSPAQYDPYV